MDVLRGLTSNALDSANQVLLRRIKGADDEVLRPHSTRDIDDCLGRIVDSAVNGFVATSQLADAFMVLAGERASRIARDRDDWVSPSAMAAMGLIERFFALRRPVAPPPPISVGQDAAAAAAAGTTHTKASPPQPLATGFDADAPQAVAARFFATAVRFYGEWAQRVAVKHPSSAPRRAAHYLGKCIDNWRPGPGHLTPAHAVLAEVCLKSHLAFVALPRLEEPVYEINPNLTGVNIIDYCDYYYFGGLCYASLQQFGRSADMLEQVLLAPAKGLSVRTIAAAKAHILVTSIHTGEGSLPPHTRMARVLGDVCREYVTFADFVARAIAKSSFDAASVQLNVPAEAQYDGMMPLLNQAAQAIAGHRTRNLTNTYLTVALTKIAEEYGGSVALAEFKLREMVLHKQLNCTIDSVKNVVTFSDDADAGGVSAATGGAASSADAAAASGAGGGDEEEPEQAALRRIVEVNKVIATRQDLTLVSPGHVLALIPSLPAAVEQAKKELDQERGGLMGVFRGK